MLEAESGAAVIAGLAEDVCSKGMRECKKQKGELSKDLRLIPGSPVKLSIHSCVEFPRNAAGWIEDQLLRPQTGAAVMDQPRYCRVGSR